MVKTIQTDSCTATMVAMNDAAAMHVMKNVLTAASIETILREGGRVYEDGEEKFVDYIVVQDNGLCLFVSVLDRALDIINLDWDEDHLEIRSHEVVEQPDVMPGNPINVLPVTLLTLIKSFNVTRENNQELLEEFQANGYNIDRLPLAVVAIGLSKIGN